MEVQKAPFINRLPLELLLAIAIFTDQRTILRLIAVCRYWRHVLTGTATLWTSIDCRSVSRTSILLKRSKSSPINVTIDRFVPEAISLVASHTHRMRSIDVNLPLDQFGGVRDLLNTLAPILEKMRLRPRDDSTHGFPPPHTSFFRGQFPALRALHLEGYPTFPIRPAPMMTKSLTTLVLDNRQSHKRCDLLGYLEHCENLVHLKIDLPNLRGTAPASRIISLPNLRELRSVLSSLATLQHLSFPPSADLIIEPRVREHIEGSPLVAAWVRDGLAKILELRTIKDIRMMFDTLNCVVALSGPHLVFMEQVKTDTIHYDTFHSDYLDSLQSLPIATTEVLRFLQPPQHPFTRTLQPQSCTRLLLQMPELKRIILDTSVTQSFVRALEPVNGQVPCPNLQVLTVIWGGSHDTCLRKGLFALSKQRKDHGCPLVCNMGFGFKNWWQEAIRLERVV